MEAELEASKNRQKDFKAKCETLATMEYELRRAGVEVENVSMELARKQQDEEKMEAERRINLEDLTHKIQDLEAELLKSKMELQPSQVKQTDSKREKGVQVSLEVLESSDPSPLMASPAARTPLRPQQERWGRNVFTPGQDNADARSCASPGVAEARECIFEGRSPGVVQDLKNQIRELMRRVQEKDSGHDEMVELMHTQQRTIDQLQAKRSNEQGTQHRLEREIQRLQADLEATGVEMSKLRERERDLKEKVHLAESVKGRQKEAEELEAKFVLAEMERLQAEVQRIAEERDRVKEDRRSAEEALAQAQEKSQREEAAAAEDQRLLQTLQELVSSQKEAAKNLQTQLAEALGRVGELEGTTQEQDHKVKKAEEDLRAANTELEMIRGQLRGREEDAKVLRGLFDGASKEKEVLQKEMIELTRDWESSKREHQRLEADLAREQGRGVRLQQELESSSLVVAELQRAGEQGAQARQALGAELKAVQEAGERTERESRAERESLRRELWEAKERAGMWAEEVERRERATQERIKLQRDLWEVQEQTGELQRGLREAQEQAQAASAEAEKLQRALAEKLREIRDLQQVNEEREALAAQVPILSVALQEKSRCEIQPGSVHRARAVCNMVVLQNPWRAALGGGGQGRDGGGATTAA